MASSSSKGQGDIYLSKEQVVQQLRRSRKFSWCIYRKRDIVRHVGILIKFDGNPFCTVDFGVKKPSLNCIVACVSEVTITKVSAGFENSVDCEDDLQCLVTETERCKDIAAEIVRKLLTLTHKKYSLLSFNCRHYVEEVVKKVCTSIRCYPESLQATKWRLLATKNEDLLFLFATILACQVL